MEAGITSALHRCGLFKLVQVSHCCAQALRGRLEGSVNYIS